MSNVRTVPPLCEKRDCGNPIETPDDLVVFRNKNYHRDCAPTEEEIERMNRSYHEE